MADNVTANAGSGGATFATDDDGTAHHPYVKVEFGADNTFTKVSTSAPLPVELTDNNNTAVADIGNILTAVQVIDNPVLVDDAAFTPATSSVMMAGFEFDDVAPDSVNEGDAGAARMSANRNVYVQIRDAAGNERGLNVDSSGQIATTLATLPDTGSGDLAAINTAVSGTLTVGSHAVTNAGTFAVQDSQAHTEDFDTGAGTDTVAAFGIAVPANGGAVVVPGDATNGLTVNLGSNNDVTLATLPDTSGGDLAAINTAVSGTLTVGSHAVTNAGTFAVQVSSALPAGTNAIGKLAANSGVDIGDVDILSIAAGSNLVGDVGISGARTSGGTTFYANLGTSTLTQIKGSAGQLYWFHAMNLKASVLYLQVFNAASASVTLGTTTPDLVFPLPTQGDTNGAGFVLAVPNGIAMGTGISFAVTTTATGSTTASAGEAYLNAGYA